MAIYEYNCKDCGKKSELLVFSDEETPKCTHCESTNLEKLMSGFAVSMAPSSSGSAPPCANGGCCSGSCGM